MELSSVAIIAADPPCSGEKGSRRASPGVLPWDIPLRPVSAGDGRAAPREGAHVNQLIIQHNLPEDQECSANMGGCMRSIVLIPVTREAQVKTGADWQDFAQQIF